MTLFSRLFTILLTLLLGGTSFAGSLQEKIDQILLRSHLAGERLSIQIVSLPDGRILYEKNPNQLLNPASNVKLVTAAAALHLLGPDYTFKTEFYADRLMSRNGTIHNLWVKGFGDPLFVTEELDSVVGRFLTAGLTRIDGSFFVDDTWFDHYNLTTYISDRNEKVTRTVTGPLSFNFNLVPLGRRGRQTVLRRARDTVEDPALHTGGVILQALEREGVGVPRILRREVVPHRALVLLTHSSPPLREILRGLGKHSNNFIAEQLLKTVGAVRYGPPGSTAKGLKVLREYLASLGILQEDFVLDNGSGLSRLNRLSASQIVRVLQDLYQQNFREDVISCLSVGGRDGTMRRKMRRSRLAGRVFAKTGSLNGVRALSGYLIDGEKKAAFSFLFNDVKVPEHQVTRVETTILELVMRGL